MKRVFRFIVPVLFLLGAFAGGYMLGRSCGSAKAFRFEDRNEFRARILEKMDSKLSLSAAQRSQIEVILEEKGKQFESLKEELKPRFSALHNETRQRIEALLDDEQKAKFEGFQSYMGRHHQRSEEGNKEE